MAPDRPLARRHLRARASVYNSTIAQVNFYRSVIADFLPRQHDPWTALCNNEPDPLPTGRCYLMELPLELKELVWEFVLTSDDEIKLSRRHMGFITTNHPAPRSYAPRSLFGMKRYRYTAAVIVSSSGRDWTNFRR